MTSVSCNVQSSEHFAEVIWQENEDVAGAFFLAVSSNNAYCKRKPVLELSLRILVATDNPIHQSVFTRMLKTMGHSVDMVTTGLLAVEMAKNNEYELVIMDLHAPVTSAVTQEIRNLQWPDNPPRIVAVISSYLEKQQLDGMDAFIEHPVTMEGLQQLCHESYQNQVPSSVSSSHRIPASPK